MIDDEQPTEAEILLEIFRETRAIKRFLYWGVGTLFFVWVLVALYAVLDAR